MLGFSEQELKATPFPSFIHPDDRAMVLDRHQKRMQGETVPTRYTFRLITKDGNTRWVEVNAVLITWEGRPATLGLLGDITERKQAEEALRASEEKFRSLFDRTPDGVYRSTPAGRYLDVNPAMVKMYGYDSREEMLALDIPRDIYFSPEERETRLRETLQGKISVFRQRRKDGAEIWVEGYGYDLHDEQGNILIHQGILRDVTDRKRAEKALRESEEKFRVLFERIPDGVYRSTHAGRFVDVNPAMVKMFGYESREEMLALDIPKDLYFAPEDREVQFLDTGQEKISVFRQRRKDGSEIWVEDHCHYVHDEGGNVLFHEGILRDVTERKRAEEEKAKLQDQLAQAQKMESVGRLAGGVAHDFNNMLSVILGHAELALGNLDPAQPLHADLTEIRKAAQRSADLTRQLLAFARKQTIAPRVLDLNDTVTGMLKMLGRLIGEDVDLLWKPGHDLQAVKMDTGQIDQILANLCVNARDAITGVGKVTIETGKAEFDQAYCDTRPGFVPGQYVLLAVSDDGCGMSKETLANIFEPFFTTKGVGEGTGLGLSTVYGIVKQNNGFINVYSEPGQGTTFRIYLPRHEAQAAALGEKREWREAATGTETVLLVEDEEALLTLCRRLLERLGYTVLAAGSSQEAIRLVEEHAGDIHLVITDVVMPEMSGGDLWRRLNALRPGLKCLFMSGYTANVIAHRAILEEGVHFLQKPFSVEALAAKVREALSA
jgi:PAS domain S-box-containing protein